jgi:hypothetical protein
MLHTALNLVSTRLWLRATCSFGTLLVSNWAYAQVLTSQGLQCGGSAVSFDSSRGATLGANGARKQELNELQSREVEAKSACGAHLDKLPGCGAVQSWLTDTKAAVPVDKNGQMPRARETDVRTEFSRVLAHSACAAGAGKRFDPACEALIDAEQAAAHLPPAGAVSAREEQIFQVAKAGQVENFLPAPGLAVSNFQQLQDKCAGKGCSAAEGQTLRVVRALSRVERFYENGPAGLAKFASESIAVRADAVPVGGHEHLAVNQAGPLVNPYLAALWKRADDQEESCERATLRVSPSGALIHQPEYDAARKRRPTLCVDTARYSIARPFEVEVAEYPLDTATGSSLRGRTYTAFPGQPTHITLPRSALIRITVRGYPSGASLRFLASRGQDLALSPVIGTSELLTQQLAAANRQVAYEQKVAGVASLTRLANSVATDAELIAAVTALNAAIATAAQKAGAKDELEAARVAAQKGVDAYRAALGRFRGGVDGSNAVNDAQAVVQAESLAPIVPAATADTAGLPAGPAGVTALQAIVVQLASIAGLIASKASELQPGVDTLARDMAQQNRTLERLCRLSNSLIPVVDEDVLIEPGGDPTRSDTYVLDYDYDAGFRRTTADKLWSNKRLFVRVRHVRPNEGVALVLDNGQVVQHAPSLIGFPTAAPAAENGAGFATSAHAVTADDDPDRPLIQARSTQILPIGKLAGGKRYDMTLCAQGGPAPPICSATAAGSTNPTSPPSTSRVIARNTIVVHEARYLGVRAGFGASMVFGRVRSISTTPGSPPQYLVTEDERTTDFALPLLLTWYPIGRDAVEGPPRFSWGLVSGIDMLKITGPPPIYFGATADVSGFGITLGGLIQSMQSVNAPANTYLPSADAGTKQSAWHGGVFAALTTDFDIFQAVFREYFSNAKWPTVGNATGGSSGGGS